MPIADIAPWLMENPAFLSRLTTLTAGAVAEDLGPSFERSPDISRIDPDWSYLLLCASFLATSDVGRCQAAALRIAQSCLTDGETTVEKKDAAALLLDTLANHPAMELALSRELLRPGLRERLPLPFRIEWTRRSIDDTIVIGERGLRVNRFQRRFWREADAHDWLSVSAPTSSGKSFIIGQWVTQLLGRGTRGIGVDPKIETGE